MSSCCAGRLLWPLPSESMILNNSIIPSCQVTLDEWLMTGMWRRTWVWVKHGMKLLLLAHPEPKNIKAAKLLSASSSTAVCARVRQPPAQEVVKYMKPAGLEKNEKNR